RDYGLVLFTIVPICLGVLAPALHGIGARRSFISMMGVSILAQFALFCGMLVFGIEGIVCILMAAPLWMTLAVIGTCIAYPLHVAMWKGYVSARGFPVAGLLIFCCVPIFMGAEHVAPSKPSLLQVSTSIDIDAPPDVVWDHVVSFPDMPRPTQWMFSLGIAR